MNQTHHTSSISRAIAIVDWISSSKDGSASVLELASKLSIPRASAYRIVNQLSEWGVLDFDSNTKRYKLGPKLLHFAKSYIQRNELINIANPFMENLRESTKETVSLNILFGLERICIHEARSPHYLHWSLPPGTKAPLYPGASGKCILAFLRPDRRKAIIEDPDFLKMTNLTQQDISNIYFELEIIRSAGYCTSREEVNPGSGSVAAPLLNKDGYSIGCITLTAPLARWDEDIESFAIIQTTECANKISNSLNI